MFTCKRCGFSSKYKSCLKTHLTRMYPCDPTLEDLSREALLNDLQPNIRPKTFPCPSCQSLFTSRQGVHAHKKICHSYQQQNQSKTVTREEYDKLQQQFADLQRQLLTQQPQCITASHINNNSNNTNTNSHNTINNTQHITVNAFGNEDVSGLTSHPNFKNFLIKCLKDQSEGLCEYLRKKHLNGSQPHNNNLRKRNKKTQFIDYYTGSEWRIAAAEKVVDNMLVYAESDIQKVLNDAIPDKRLKYAATEFMEGTGTFLEWNLNGEHYEYEDDDEHDCNVDEDRQVALDRQKQKIKQRICMLVCEYIHRFSKMSDPSLA
jgi:hypothetical protein